MYLMHVEWKQFLPETRSMRLSMTGCVKMVCTIAAVLCIPFQQASADIYQYTDKDGVIHFSNVGVVKGKKVTKVKSESPARSLPESRANNGVSRRRTTASAPVAYSDAIYNSCERHGVDPALVHAIVKVESDFNPYALSSKGAMGLMQLMPQTAIDMNVRNTFNPHENIDGGVRYLRYLIDRYAGNLSLALAAYNAGETAVKKWGTIPPFMETQNYVQRVLKLYNGTGTAFTSSPRYTIFIGYGEDGALLLTDDPSKQKLARTKHKARKEL
jgi:hypothetical protein